MGPGTTLGERYVLSDRIAGGGMGDVWRAKDSVLGRTVAVKVLLPALLDDPGFAARFRAEARTMAALDHPGIVDVYDFGHRDGTAYLVMRYVDGESLDAVLARLGRLDPEHAMRLVAQAADALHAAHVTGIVHRDVKPGNLLLRADGQLVLTDFGIARSPDAMQLTDAGVMLGTAAYLSPEQVNGETVSAASDVYALGVVAYLCLTGRRPFDGETPLAIALKQINEEPPPLPSAVPAPVRELVTRALAKHPAGRWPSAAAMAEAARCGGGDRPVQAVSAPPTVDYAMDGQPVAGRPPSAVRPGAAAGTPDRPPPVPLSAGRPADASGESTDDRGGLAAGGPAAGRRRALPVLVTCAAIIAVLAAGAAVFAVIARSGAVRVDRGTAADRADPAPDRSTTEGASPAPSTTTGRPSGSERANATAPLPPGGQPPPTQPTQPGATPIASATPGPNKIIIPDVVGITAEAARTKLTDLGLAVKMTYRQNEPACIVADQEPNAGQTVERGDSVTIAVGAGIVPC